jgi:hypothetical protein
MNLPPQVALCKTFKLRDDFEEEIGFVDFLRTPLSPEEWDTRVARMHEKGQPMLLSYEEHVSAKASAPVEDRFAIFAFRPADSKVAVPIVTDFHSRLRVDFAGLFYDTLLRANIAMGRSVGGESLIAPSSLLPISNVPIYPPYFVMHDRRAALGYVIPWELYEPVMNPWGSP